MARKGHRKKSGFKRAFTLAAALAVLAVAALYFNLGGVDGVLGLQGDANSGHGGSVSVQAPGTVILDAQWGDAAAQLVSAGALNISSLPGLLASSGEPLTQEQLKILNGSSTSKVTLGSQDALFTLYVLWALGINNKNDILSKGPVSMINDPYRLASTGGYGPLGRLQLDGLSVVSLSAAQQNLAEQVAYNAYRPCCDNPAAFPDCNHGAAQLGLIELMASQGRSSAEIFSALQKFNEFYYASYYSKAAVYLGSTQHVAWDSVPASTVMSKNISSYSSMAYMEQYLQNNNMLPQSGSGSSSCGV